jgi:large subunit ribosomal protein L17
VESKVAGTRKLGKPTDQRLAMLKTQTTDLILNGKLVTTEARAKEVKAIVDSVIALAVKEHKNYEEVEVKVVKAKLDDKGRKVTEKVTSKNGKEYLRVVKEEKMEKRQKDMPSRLNARRKLMKKVNKVEGVDLMNKLFNELAPKYEGRVGGYTRILKMEPRKGDNSKQAILMLV